MRKCGGALFLLLVFLLWPGIAVADIVQTGQVELEGVVPPMRCLVVNDQSQIIEVTSNTSTYIKPTVFRNKIMAGSEINLTPSVEQQYKTLGNQTNLNRVGIVYRRSLTDHIVKKPLPLLLSVLSWHNYDYLMSSIFNHEL